MQGMTILKKYANLFTRLLSEGDNNPCTLNCSQITLIHICESGDKFATASMSLRPNFLPPPPPYPVIRELGHD